MGSEIPDGWELFSAKLLSRNRAGDFGEAFLVTIQRDGRINLSSAADAALGAPDRVELLWHPDRKIAIRATDSPEGFTLGPLMLRRTRQVNAAAFMASHSLHHPQSTAYPARLIGGMVVVDLNQPGAAVNQGGRLLLPRGSSIMAGWEEWSDRSRTPRISCTPAVRIDANLYVHLNTLARRVLGDPHHIQFLYNRESGEMGIRAGVGDAASSYSARSPRTGRRHRISGARFFRYYGYGPEIADAYPAGVEDGVLVVSLPGK